jgi:hypothetical protein
MSGGLSRPLGRWKSFTSRAATGVILSAHAGDEVVRAEPFAEVEIDLRTLWEEPIGGP